MKHHAKHINSIGDWELFYKPWSGGITAHKVLRNSKLKLDIINDGTYKIYSSKPISGFVLDKKSESKHEPRPYYYHVSKEELINHFNDLDIKLIDALDNRTYYMNQLGM